MRQITKNAVNSFLNAVPFKSSNTEVRVIDWNKGKAVSLYLHGNMIAEHFTSTGITKITNAGGASNTTKERLNALPNVSIRQVKGIWYLNGKEWDGSLTTVN